MTAVRKLVMELPYRNALSIVALMNEGAGRSPRVNESDPEAVAIARDTAEREARGFTGPDCPGCGSSDLYERGNVPGSARGYVYLECGCCGAWSWPPRDPKAGICYQLSLRDMGGPSADDGLGDVVRHPRYNLDPEEIDLEPIDLVMSLGLPDSIPGLLAPADVFALAALAFQRFEWDDLDLVTSGAIGLSDYESCGTPGCPGKRPVAANGIKNARYCDSCKDVRKKATAAARYQDDLRIVAGELPPRLGRVEALPRCCQDNGGRQCEQHEGERDARARAVAFSPSESARLLELFDPYGSSADKELRGYDTGRDNRLRNQRDNPNRGPDEGESPGTPARPRRVFHASPFAPIEADDASAGASAVREARAWFIRHRGWSADLAEVSDASVNDS